jgi:pyruvate dehydrogenase E1 component beta subunit
MFMNLGGINIAVPATPADAKGLMKSALRGFNPTIFLLPRVRGATSGEVSDDPDFLVPYGKASVMQEGSDVTIVAIGSCVHHAIRAAKALAEDGISVELIDPRTLVPLDTDTIVASVRKTGRLVVVDEARDRCSAASHIAAVVGDEAFSYLKAPIKRVTSPNIPMPYAPALERALLPDPDKIIAAVRLVMAG